jgi:hypothetical protein
MSDNNSGEGGLGIVGVVTVVFITLKALEIAPVADWSWGFVIFGPFLIGISFWLVVFGLFGAVLGVGAAGAGLSSWFGRRQMRKFNEMADVEEEKEREQK